jgi:Bifunctional DNA primase/polymerase, N-terminal
VNSLEAAIATGLPCFPCRADKSPATPHGFYDATADPAAQRALWRRYPGPLVGVPTGEASELAVLDVDTAKHPEAVAWFAAARPRLPVTRTHQTRSGGLHLVLQHARGVRNTASRLAKGIDTRGDGGFVIWWPAAGCPVLCDAPPAQWPGWLLQALLPQQKEALTASSIGPGAELNDHRLDGLLRRVKFAPESQRNCILYWGSRILGTAVRKGEINKTAAEAALLGAALHAGLPEREARLTIASGFRTTAT